MTDVLLEAGTLTASEDTRSVSGLLLPWNEEGNSNLGRFAIDPDAVAIPRDPSVVTLNIGHDREQPVGRATALSSTDAGIVATFAVADTDEGDTLLAEIAAGTRTKLSAEVRGVVLRAGRAIGGALFGAAAVERGAFPSAALLAEDAGDTPEPSEDTPSEETTEADEEAENTEENVMTDATAPATLTAAPEATPLTKAGLFAAIATGHRTGNASSLREFERASDATMFAALKDITEAGNPAVAVPAFIGELWSGKAYERRYVPLFNSAELTSSKVRGWRWVVKPTVAKYSGNKTAVPSNQPSTEAVEFESYRIAGAHDIDRRFRDFGDQSFLNSYFAAMTESYAQVSDLSVLADIEAAATPLVPGAVPAGVAKGLAYIVDGALKVIDNVGFAPNFAVVSSALYREIALSPKDGTFEFLNASIGLEEGALSGFRILPSSHIEANTVLVGNRSAATVHELGGGSPIRVEGLDVARGGIDPGVFGYLGTVVHDASGIVKVKASA